MHSLIPAESRKQKAESRGGWELRAGRRRLLRRFRDMNGLEKGGRVDHLHRRHHIKTLNVRYEHHCGTDHGGHHEMQRVQRENSRLYSKCAHLTLKSEYRIVLTSKSNMRTTHICDTPS